MRCIPPELKTFWDLKLAGMDSLPPHLLMVEAAMVCVGTKDADPMVNLFRTTLGTAHGQSWCMDFVQACIAYVEEARGLKSDVVASEGVLDVWNRSKLYNAISGPRPGDIICWQERGSSWAGHCGIVNGKDSVNYLTIEGNTTDSLAIARQGDGVYTKKRSIGGTRTFLEMGFLRCFP